MRHLTIMAGALAVALTFGSGAFAQVPPPDPNNPNEAVPEKHAYMPYGETITLEFMVWDTGDHIYDSSVIIDNWTWSPSDTTVSTGRPPN